MKDYLYYKNNKNEEYDYTDTIIPSTPKHNILLGCIQCKQTYACAYSCKDTECVHYNLKKKWMKRPHTCSEWFKENRNKIEDKWI